MRRSVGRTDVDGRRGGVGGVSGSGGGAGKAGRGVLHTSSCRLKREDEGGGKGGGTDELRIMPRGKNMGDDRRTALLVRLVRHVLTHSVGPLHLNVEMAHFQEGGSGWG